MPTRQLTPVLDPKVVDRLAATLNRSFDTFEHEHTMPRDDDYEVARRLILCEVRDGKIADVTVYCNGGWDADVRARQAAEAPMLRP